MTHNLTRCALAAVAVLLLNAANSEASVVTFALDEEASQVTLGGTLDVSPVFGHALGTDIVSFNPQFGFFGAAGNKSHYGGYLNVDLQPGTIQLLPGASQVFALGNVPNPFFAYVDDLFLPSSNPSDPLVFEPGNYGLRFNVPLLVTNYVRISDLQVSPSSDRVPNAPRTLSGPVNAQVFSVGQEVWEGVDGDQWAFGPLFGHATSDLANWSGAGLGVPLPLGGALNVISGNQSFTPNGTTGVWDAVSQTLTINVNGSLKYLFNGLIATNTYNGQLVMHAIPEPSTLVLGCTGLVGLALLLRRRLRCSSLIAAPREERY